MEKNLKKNIYIYIFFPQGLVVPWHVALSSPIRDGPHLPCIGRWILNHWTASEVPSQSIYSCLAIQLSSLGQLSRSPFRITELGWNFQTGPLSIKVLDSFPSVLLHRERADL